MKTSRDFPAEYVRAAVARFITLLTMISLCTVLSGCIVSVTASSDDGHVPENTIDNSLDPESRWSAYGDGEWIQYELTTAMPVDHLDIAFYRGDSRRSFFEIWTGKDVDTLSRVYRGRSSGNTLDFERFHFPVQEARIVRIVGYGNSENDWNSITEVSVGEKNNGNDDNDGVAGDGRAVLLETFENRIAGSRWMGMRLATVQNGCGVGGGRCLRVNYEPYSGGSRRLVEEIPVPAAREYTLQYDVRFGADFEFVRGGKMHWLGPVNKTTGCNPIEPDGWSARIMWRQYGVAQLYAYHQDRQNNCGDGRLSYRILSKRNYQAVSLYVRVNSARDVSDGEIAVYINGTRVARWNNIRLRSDINRDTEINNFLFSTFHGGNDSSWSPSQTVIAWYDNFAVMPGLDVREEPGAF